MKLKLFPILLAFSLLGGMIANDAKESIVLGCIVGSILGLIKIHFSKEAS